MIRGAVRNLAAFARRFLTERRGSIAIKFAFAAPAIMMFSAGAIDLAAVRAADSKLQSIADAAALAAAPSLALATDGAEAKERAEAFVAAEMTQWEDHPSYRGAYEIVDRMGQRAIHVTLTANRPSFFANLLPPGGWNFVAEAVASSVGLVPLCVLVSADKGKSVMNVKDTGRINAPACLVHSNRDIAVDGGSVQAASVQAVTTASGFITPQASTGAAKIDDPFANLDVDRTEGLGVLCTVSDLLNRIKVNTGVMTVSPGRHCGGIEASGDARIILAPGDHFFLRGSLVVSEDARLEGDDVVLFFDNASKFQFADRAMVNLTGRREGQYAGIVMGSTRKNRQDFVISADHVESLLGVIYVPSARLVVEGSADVARDSAWTVIVADQMLLRGSPSLFINANYNASSVPVPAGVGPRAGGARLVE
jgi:hypothetical protein